MRVRPRFSSSVIVLLGLLSLISCTTKSNISLTPSLLPGTPAPSTTSTTVDSMVTYTATLTSVPSSIPPLPAGIQFTVPSGRVLFVRDSIRNDTGPNGLILLDRKNNESTLVVQKNQEFDGQTLLLSYPRVTWSPDGHWIAFVAINTENNFFWHAQEDIYVVKSDGTGLRRLTDSPRYSKRSIAWSPDGKYILVAMGISTSDLYLVDVVNGEIVRRLTSNGNKDVAVWLPDGNRIAFLDDSAWYIMNISDKGTERLNVPSNHRVLDIAWSPTNNKIAFTSMTGDSKCDDIYTVDINTGEVTNITSSEYYEISPEWLPDGNHLLFLRSVVTCAEMGGKRDWDMYITDLAGEEHKIVSSTGSETTIAWAPVPNLEISQQYTITALGANLNLRAEPSLHGKILESLPAGEVIKVLDGYVDAEEYYWWKIRTADGTEGWAVEMANWYKPLNE